VRWTAAVAGAAGEGSWARVERRLLRARGCFAAAVGGAWAHERRCRRARARALVRAGAVYTAPLMVSRDCAWMNTIK
jgi:hypothetical protein